MRITRVRVSSLFQGANPRALTSTLLFMLLGCGREAGWSLQRQVIDEAGSPISGVKVSVTEYPSPNTLQGQLRKPVGNTHIVHTDLRGFFHLDTGSGLVVVRLECSGYIPKEYHLFPGSFEAEGLRPSGQVVLKREHSLIKPDELDREGERDVLVTFERGTNAVGVDFRQTHVVEVQDRQTDIVLQCREGKLTVLCQRDVWVSSTDWEPGLTVESWKENNWVIGTRNWRKDYGIVYKNSPNSVVVCGAFFLKSESWCARVYILAVTQAEFRLCFDLSSDRTFLSK